MVKVMSHASTGRWATSMSFAVGLCLSWSFSHAGAITDGRSAIGPAASNTISAPTATEATARPMGSVSVPIENGLVLRSMPTVSKPISVGGTTLVPYLGAGFGGGYATELDRSLHTAPAASALSNSANAGLRNLFGQQLIPNEVQLGIRFPF